jgi:dTDP-4-amino-4,6-dideoxygalactose transaminase
MTLPSQQTAKTNATRTQMAGINPAARLPALLAGEAVRPGGPPDWPVADDAVRAALDAAWHDGSWGRYRGGNVEHLEARLAAGWGVPHVLCCGSGTFAVELALRALKVGPGDEVVLAAYDYPGNFLAVHAVGARPVLVDVAPLNWNLDASRVAAALTPQTRAVIASHLHGGLVPMCELADLTSARGIPVVEDAAQAAGAVVQGKPAGSWGDVGVLSFGGSKLLTAGRGGAILTNRAEVAQRARLAQERGNVLCPLSELQAAVLLPQLDRLADRHDQRRRRVARLSVLLGDVPGLEMFRNAAAGDPAYYKVGFRFDAAVFGLDRQRFVAALRAEGIAFDEGFQALHVGRSPTRWRGAGSLAEAERAGDGAVVLHHPVLLGDQDDVEQVATAVRKVHDHTAALAAL